MNTKKAVEWIVSDNCYIFECPHCNIPVQVEGNQVNCQIFRHGQMKDTYTVRFSSGVVLFNVPLSNIEGKDGTLFRAGDKVKAKSSPGLDYEDAQILLVNEGRQIPPHSPRKVCDDLVAKGLIWGCGKPFKLIKGTSGRVEFAEKCGYI